MRMEPGADAAMGDTTGESGPGPLVEAVLLCRGPETVETLPFLKDLNELAQPLGQRFAFEPDARPEGEGEVAVFQSEDFHVTVREVAAPASAFTFSSALSDPCLPVTFPTAQAVVDGHVEHVVVRVNRGAWDAADTDLDLDDFQPDAMLPKLRLLKMACGAYARSRFPIALYWSAADNLMAGPNFMQFVVEGGETELFVRAVPFSSGMDDGVPTVGVVTLGATQVIGREVELDEAPVPMAWAVQQVLAFVTHSGDALPPDGATLRSENALLIAHHEAPSERFPFGRVRLSVEKPPARAVVDAPPLAAEVLPVVEPVAVSDEPPRRVKAAFGRR